MKKRNAIVDRHPIASKWYAQARAELRHARAALRAEAAADIVARWLALALDSRRRARLARGSRL